jgi:hypothetical protein
MRRCIYCLQEKAERAFNREHVIPQGFGLFDGHNLVLSCVCLACNQTFGDDIDMHLLRDSLEGHDRFLVGVRSPSKYKSLGRRSTSRIEFEADGPLHGAIGYLTPSSGTTLGSTTAPCVRFVGRHGRSRWYPLGALPPKREIELAVGFRHGEEFRIETQGEDDLDSIRGALERVGFSGLPSTWTKSPPYQGPVRGEAVFRLHKPHWRALAKISLNYLAAIFGAEVALAPELGAVRKYILTGEGERPVEVPPKAHRQPQPYHYVAVKTVGDRLVAHVSLFFRVTSYTVTLAPLGFARPIASAHLFDVGARRVSRVLPLPAKVSSAGVR